MSKEEKYMRLALSEAKKAYEKKEVPIGAVLVYEDKVITKAHNLRESKQSTLGHAELLCLEKANKKWKSWRLENCELYVTLEPCPMCASALQQARIKKVFFACTDPKAGAVCSCDHFLDKSHLNHKVLWEKGLLENEASSLLKQFFKELREGKHKFSR